MEQWDDSLILECYEKAVREHETRGNLKGGSESNKKRKGMTGSVLQSNIGEPGPWQTYDKVKDEEDRREKAYALYAENEEINKTLNASNIRREETPSSSSPFPSVTVPCHGDYLEMQMDEALHSMMMSW